MGKDEKEQESRDSIDTKQVPYRQKSEERKK